MVKILKPLDSRRERRIKRRRYEIVNAAALIFAEKGYVSTTTKEIAEAADMAEGTLYNYFGTKRDILLAIVEEAQPISEALFKEVSTLNSREDIITWLDKSLEVFMSRLPFARTLFAEVWLDDALLEKFVVERLKSLFEFLQNFISERIEAGIFRPVDTELATRMILGMFIAPILPILRGIKPPLSTEERHYLAEMTVDLLFNGMRVRQG
ncbi:MAG: TetR/AcrR family transcriptional regulator [Anaerolineae bacterium]|nr:TetR/AcrR family transcriptional regulator [Anaerolineae bacterium]